MCEIDILTHLRRKVNSEKEKFNGIYKVRKNIPNIHNGTKIKQNITKTKK